ncbi:serpin family protein [Demequina gelatinilytica]|uniref:serpin family protein n=1 Tax=Demequina gelatinilytica TaxID=1638980 RepID=UPI000780635F|nr:serpin family protein [Demequina gelatinilytica]
MPPAAETAPEIEVARPAPTPSAAVPLAASFNDAGLTMFRAAAADRNLALSPISIGLAFGMVDAGATGTVDDALEEVFAYPAQGEALLNAFNSLDLAIASEKGDGAPNAEGDTVDLPIVRVANAAWFDEGFTPDPAYVETVQTWFGAQARTLPLAADPEGSREEIDGWVEDRTEGLIPRVLPESVPGPDTRLILVNTLYLKAQWWDPFSEAGTYEDDFTRLDGSVTDAELMTQAFDARYATTDAYDAAVLPYVGGLEMVLIVPRSGRFEEVRGTFDVDALAGLDGSLAEGYVLVQLPRFETASTVDLRAVIADRMGIAGLFGEIGLDGIGPELEVGAAVHATKVIVDEDGTEAAAATVIEGMAGSMPPEPVAEIIADRPFLYAVRDTETGAILLVGQYLDPDGD